jgi:acyl carrier protein
MDELNNFSEIFAVVSGIIMNITDNAGLKIEPSHTAKDVKNWDSLRHVMIINEIENHYVIQFDLMEMLDISSVGDICHAVLKKKASV